MRFSLLLIFLMLMSCQVTKNLSYCDTLVTVIDLKGLDGCGLLLKKENGEKLLPVNGDVFNFTVNQQLAISYQSFDGMSICMAEQQMVTLGCVQRLSPLACQPVSQIQSGHWLEAIFKNDNPIQINRFHLMDQYLYQVMVGTEDKWYDCRGQLICDLPEECQIDLSKMKEKLEIYVAHR